MPVETEAAAAEKAKRSVGPLALFGLVLGGFGVVLVAAIVVIYLVNQ